MTGHIPPASGLRWFAAVTLVTTFIVAFAPSRTLRATDIDAAWKQKNDHGNRYEGVRTFPVNAAPVLDVYGFFSYRDRVLANEDASLTAHFFLAGLSPSVRLTAREIQRVAFYWMEAKEQNWHVGWNSFEPWQMSDVLRGVRVGVADLAVLVRTDGAAAGSGVIAPTALCAHPCHGDLNSYELYLNPSKALTRVRFEVTSTDGRSHAQGVIGPKAPNITFPVRFALSNIADGWMTITIVTPIANRLEVPPPTTFRFYHVAHLPK